MKFKKILNKVKENHKIITDKARQSAEKSINGEKPGPKFDEFSPEEKIKKGLGIKEDIFSSIVKPEEKFIPEPEVVKIREIVYPPISKNGNYIIQPGDTPEIIAAKVFGSEKMAGKLLEWGFIKSKRDLAAGREIAGLKYTSPEEQLNALAKKFKINTRGDLLIFGIIAAASRTGRVPPLISLLACSTDKYQEKGSPDDIGFLPGKINYWQPMQINDRIYPEAFPNAALNIEFNINQAISILAKLKKSNKNWPRTISAYFTGSVPGKGLPEEQKIIAKEVLAVLEALINKMADSHFKSLVRGMFKPEDENDISFEILFRELEEFYRVIGEKYL
jgi:hypothetical protein